MDTFTIQLLFGVTMFYATTAIILAAALVVGMGVQYFMPKKKIMTFTRFMALLAISLSLQFISLSLQAAISSILGNVAQGLAYFGLALLLGFAVWLLLYFKYKTATQLSSDNSILHH